MNVTENFLLRKHPSPAGTGHVEESIPPHPQVGEGPPNGPKWGVNPPNPLAGQTQAENSAKTQSDLAIFRNPTHSTQQKTTK